MKQVDIEEIIASLKSLRGDIVHIYEGMFYLTGKNKPNLYKVIAIDDGSVLVERLTDTSRHRRGSRFHLDERSLIGEFKSGRSFEVEAKDIVIARESLDVEEDVVALLRRALRRNEK